MKTLGTLMEEVGPFGRFQMLQLPLSYSSLFMAIMSMMFMVFGAVEPDWWCVPSRDQNNQSHLSAWNASHEISEAAKSFPLSAGVGNNTTVLFPMDSSAEACEELRRGDGACERIEFSAGMVTVVTEFGLVCDLFWISSLIISLQMVGVLVGAGAGGQLADSLGRKKTMVSFTVLHGVFNLIAAFSVNWYMFAATRALIGSTIGGLLVVFFPYPTEFLGVKWRAIVATIPFWGIGAIAFSLLCWLLPHWMYLHIIIGAGSLACLPAWIFLPESVRWLVVKGRVTEAHQVLCQMARWNGRKAPFLSSVQALCSHTDHSPKKYSYFHIFSTRKMMKMSSLTGLMWFSASMTYYGISFGIKNLSGSFHFNFFLMVLLETPSSLLVYHLTAWLGRRWTTFGALLIVCLSLLAVIPITLLLPEAEAGSYVTWLCMVARCSLSMGWSAMTLFHTELYPTVVRNIGIGYCNLVARFGGILAPYLLSMRQAYIFYALLSGVMALSTVAPLFMPETRGRPLRDDLDSTSEEEHAGKGSNNGVEMNSPVRL